MNTPWQIQLFGGLRAHQHEHVLEKFRTQKAASLLARLVFYPHRSHPREELIDQLWPDADLDAGRASLRQALASLRRQLEPPGTPFGAVLTADRLMVRINPAAVRTDVAGFEAALKAASRTADVPTKLQSLSEALSLYAGELLPGLYDDWVLTERERLALGYENARRQYEELRGQQTPSASVAAEAPATVHGECETYLPLQFNRFFGRTEELLHIAALLQDRDMRLVTLTGTGGTGKTRFSIEAARRAAAGRQGLVCFVPLSDISDSQMIPGAIAASLSLPHTEVSVLDLVVSALAEKRQALLVLDNLEQIAEGAVPVILALLTRAPRLQIIAVSRTRLYVAGEREFPLAPLPVPAAASATPEELSALAGVQLFVDRAQRARADFQITPRNAEAVASICRQVEGIPLALELAAAWVQVLTPRQIVERLQERFSLLVNRRKETPERHRTLWAAISWSYGLLSPELQRFWTRLSVFRGGCTAEAARDVCGEAQALSLLTQLQARSLVLTEDAGLDMRFRLLETLREFAWSQQSVEDQSQISRRHTDFFLRLTQEAKLGMISAGQADALGRLDAEDANMRAALGWALEHDGTAALEMADALWRFWDIRGRYAESTAAVEAALAAAPDAPAKLRSAALSGAGSHFLSQGRHDEARLFLERALCLYREGGNEMGVSAALHNLAMLAQHRGELGRAQLLYQESYEISDRLGDLQGCALTLNNLGRVTFAGGDYAAARLFFEKSLAIKKTGSDRKGIANSLGNLGTVAQLEGDVTAAEDYFRRCLRLQAEIGDRTGIALSLINLCDAARRQGDWGRVTTLLAAAHATQPGLLAGLTGSDRAEVETGIEEARQALPRRTFDAAWATGTALAVEEVVAYALSENSSVKPQ